MGKPSEGFHWKPHIQAGVSYDLAHLHPFQWAFDVAATRESPAVSIAINVSFGMHCFSRDAADGERVDATARYADNREVRVFCTHRYELSKRLPDIVRTLDQRRCMHTGREEFVTVQLIVDGRAIEYAVFFTVSRAGKQRSGDLNLFVNSAHERIDGLRYSKPIALRIILLNTLRGKAIKPPP